MSGIDPAKATGRTSISPWLSVDDVAKALGFYAAAFGATERYRHGGTDEEPDVVAELGVGDTTFWVSDESPEYGNSSPETIGGSTAKLLQR